MSEKTGKQVVSGFHRPMGVNTELLTAPARKAYEEAKTTAGKAYYEATAPVWKAYFKAIAIAERDYLEATAPTLKAYQEAIATAFWDLFANPENRSGAWK